jgi:2-C-methyl-D-erythritol 2,4-cyclodiphosphate synthase
VEVAELSFRVGLGVDVHAFAGPVEGRRLILGGVEIPFEKGLAGHSDADVLAHAITDALLGAAGLEDIGHYFPDTDERYRDADSIGLLRAARELIGDSWSVANVDAVVICERPKIRNHRDAMRENLAGALGVDASRVTVRGTTSERLGFPGRGEGIAAQAVCLLESRADRRDIG